MTLSEGQKSSIQTGIECLLDFSDEISLQVTIQKLNQALTMSVTKEHPFYWLRECFIKPTAYFQRLEKAGDPHQVPTLYDVQEYMISFITININDIVKRKQIDPAILTWAPQNILNQLPDSHRTCPFISEKLCIPEEDLWQLTDTTGKTYTQQLSLEERQSDYFNKPAKTYISLNIAVQIGSLTKVSQKKLKQIPAIFQSDEEADRFLNEVKQSAELRAEKFATSVAINYFSEKDPLFRLAIQHSKKQSKSVLAILTNAYFVEVIDKQKIKLKDILYLTTNEAKNLTHPSIITLLKNHIISFFQAKYLSENDKKIITHPFYFSKILNKQLHLKTIYNISDYHSKALLHPFITKLIQENKITIRQVKLLPKKILSLFIHHDYINLFLLNPLDWRTITHLKDYHIDFLTNPPISSTIAKLITNNVINFSHIQQSSRKEIDWLTTHPCLLHWLEQRTINWHQALNNNIISFASLQMRFYAERLFHFFNIFPQTINHYSENLKKFFNDLTAENITWAKPEVVNEWIIYHFTLLMIKNMEEKSKTQQNEIKKFFYQQMLQFLLHPNINYPFTSQQLFMHFATIANDTLTRLAAVKYIKQTKDQSYFQTENTFFIRPSPQTLPVLEAKINSDYPDLKIFCQQLTLLAKEFKEEESLMNINIVRSKKLS